MRDRICIIGLSREMSEKVQQNHFGPVIHHDVVPKFLVDTGRLFIERSNGIGMLQVDKVIFHGIFENDFDLLVGLSIWNGPCYPNANSMMNCRLKLPCLARALKVSKFNTPRGLMSAGTQINFSSKRVGKWGNWHCGDNKEIIKGAWESKEASIIEPFFEGEAVRVVIIGNTSYQIQLEGETWLKSIHSPDAHFMPIDKELLEDTERIKSAFGMDIIANDYIMDENGKYHLLEVNHIPNVTRFEKLEELYLNEVIAWLNK